MSADGGALRTPFGVCLDSTGCIIVADLLSNTIKRIVGGVATTLAGSGERGYVNGAGRSASFCHPSGVCMDGDGNILVADRDNHVIRLITPAGVVSTLAGASFNNPVSVCVDSEGNCLVADRGNHRIMRISPDGQVSTLAGTGRVGADNGPGESASFNFPMGVCMDGAGNCLVADTSNSLVRSITPAGYVTTFAGGFSPSSVCVDSTGHIFASDSKKRLIWRITPAGATSISAGSGEGADDGVGGAASFRCPHGVCVDSEGNCLVADVNNGLIRRCTAAGVVSTVAGRAAGSEHIPSSSVPSRSPTTSGGPTTGIPTPSTSATPSSSSAGVPTSSGPPGGLPSGPPGGLPSGPPLSGPTPAAQAQLVASAAAAAAAEERAQTAAVRAEQAEAQLKEAKDAATKREAELQAELEAAAASAAAATAAAAADAAAALADANAKAKQRETELLARLSALETQARDAVEQARVAEGKLAVLAPTPAALLQELKDARQELKVHVEQKAEQKAALDVKVALLEADKLRQATELGAQGAAVLRVVALESQLVASAARVGALESELREARSATVQAGQHSLLVQQLMFNLQQTQRDLEAERRVHQSSSAAAAAAAALAAAGAGAPSGGAGALAKKEEEEQSDLEPRSPTVTVRAMEGRLSPALTAEDPLCAGVLAALASSTTWKARVTLPPPPLPPRCFVKCYSLHSALALKSVKDLEVLASQLRQEAVMQKAAAEFTPYIVRVLGWMEHGAPPPPATSGPKKAAQWVVGLVLEPCGVALPSHSSDSSGGSGGSGGSSSSSSSSSSSAPISDLGGLLDQCVVPFGVRLGLARHVAHGLAACALLRLRHRDVKPENVMLCSDAGAGAGAGAGAARGMPSAPPLVQFEGLALTAKLGDFGSASQLARGGRATHSSHTETDYTLEFAAPEYLLQHLAREEEREKAGPPAAALVRKVPRGDGAGLTAEQAEALAAARVDYDKEELPRTIVVTPSVDVFAFGVLLWELVARGGGASAAAGA